MVRLRHQKGNTIFIEYFSTIARHLKRNCTTQFQKRALILQNLKKQHFAPRRPSFATSRRLPYNGRFRKTTNQIMELAKSFEPADIEKFWRTEWEQRGYFTATTAPEKTSFSIQLSPPGWLKPPDISSISQTKPRRLVPSWLPDPVCSA